MNDNGLNTGPPKIPLICVRCQQHWSVTPNPVEIFNTPRCSGLTMAHERLIRCPSATCQQPYIITIQQAQLALAVQPVDDALVEQMEGSRLIRPDLKLM